MYKAIFFLVFIISSIGLITIASASQTKQSTLDKACESARQKALLPRKKEIYKECINKFKKEEKICQEEANAFNGNRINGAPMFYELPECVKAFEYQKKNRQ